MKKISLLLMLIIAVFIQACTTSTGHWEDHPFSASKPGGGYEKNYQLGMKKICSVGQEIIHLKKYGKTIHYATALDDYTIHFSCERILKRIPFINIERMFRLWIDKNTAYTLDEFINLSEKYYLLHLPEEYRWRLLISTDGRIFKKSLYDGYYDSVYTPDKEIIIEPNNFKFLITESYAEPLFSFDLIYGGINDVSLNITYREYTGNDYARPSFFQNLTYNTDVKQIRFKDFLIQIHDATNEQITYTVLEDGLI